MAHITYDSLIISQARTPRAGFLETLRLWRRRVRERGELARLDDRMLHDLALTPSQVAFEVQKPFWRG